MDDWGKKDEIAMQCHQSQFKRSAITLQKVSYRPAKGQLLNVKTYSAENQTVKNVSQKSCTGTYAQTPFTHGSYTDLTGCLAEGVPSVQKYRGLRHEQTAEKMLTSD